MFYFTEDNSIIPFTTVAGIIVLLLFYYFVASSGKKKCLQYSRFYTNKLPPTNLPNDPFDKSADLSRKSIQDNPHDQRKDPATCPHARSENWNSNRCADCGILVEHV